jgi:hypothetical protein
VIFNTDLVNRKFPNSQFQVSGELLVVVGIQLHVINTSLLFYRLYEDVVEPY